MFQKGHKKLGGKIKGQQNKKTVEIKEAFKQLVEKNLDNITSWMQQVAEKDPIAALEFMHKFAQFNVPLIARQELTAKDGEDLKIIVTDEKITEIGKDL